jgi:hypothetical protein
MRYKCIGSPDCMKTFEFGHALRAHIASCESAQRLLKKEADIKKLEYHVGIDYSGIFGIKGNKYYPTFTSLDTTLRFNFIDRFRFTPLESKYSPTDSSSATSMRATRRMLKASSSHLMGSAQMRQLLQNEEFK